MKNYFILITLSSFAFGQQKIHLQNSNTNEPVLYANIWNENKLYTTSDSLGDFYFKQKEITNLKITAIGYTDTIVNSINDNILLKPKEIILNEVKISNPVFHHFKRIGKASKRGNIFGVNFNAEIALFLKFIPNISKSGKECFINSVSFYANTSAKNRKVNIILYSIDEVGKPKEIINKENIIVTLREGTALNKIDLKKFKIVVPKSGLFVGIQHLLIDENKYFPHKNNNSESFSYEPFLYITENPDILDSWYFENGNWLRSQFHSLNLEIEISD